MAAQRIARRASSVYQRHRLVPGSLAKPGLAWQLSTSSYRRSRKKPSQACDSSGESSQDGRRVKHRSWARPASSSRAGMGEVGAGRNSCLASLGARSPVHSPPAGLVHLTQARIAGFPVCVGRGVEGGVRLPRPKEGKAHRDKPCLPREGVQSDYRPLGPI